MDIEARKIALIYTPSIREDVSLNKLVAKQQTIPISYKEIQESTKRSGNIR